MIAEWLAANPAWIGAFIGLIAFLESLAVVGLLVPGAALLFMAGALVGGSGIAVWPMLIWAFVGAVLGDGLSYWLGRRFQHRIPHWPGIRRYPGALAQGQALFARYGGGSVVIGRFVGPVRPIIPAVAGMLGMAPGRFILANLGSALVWAPVYLLPGVLFGASLMLAMGLLGRIVAWVVLIVGGVVILRWLLPRIDRPLRLMGNRIARAIGREPSVTWQHPLLLPLHSAIRGLRYRLGWLWWVAWIGFVGTVVHAFRIPGPTGWEQGWLALADAQRSAAVYWVARQVTVFGTELAVGLAAFALALVLWLTGQPRRGLLVIVSMLLVQVLMIVPGLFAWRVPSAHAAGVAALVAIWLAVIPRRELLSFRLVLGMGTVLVLSVAASRLVLGVHWPLDLLGSASLGLLLGGLPVLAGQRANERFLARPGLAVSVSALVLVLSGSLFSALGWPDAPDRYPPRAAVPLVAAADWWQGEVTLREQRLSLIGLQETMTAEWLAGRSAPAGFVRNWRSAPYGGWRNLVRWLTPQPDPAWLPVVPRWHEGRQPAVVRIQPLSDGKSRLVLRAWRGAVTEHGVIWQILIEREIIRPGVWLPRFERETLSAEAAADELATAASWAFAKPADDPRARVPRYASDVLPQRGISP